MKNRNDTVFVLGGDGYLGWSLGLAFAARTDLNVVLIDSMVKREWEKEVKARSLVPFVSPGERIRAYKKIFGKSNLSFINACLLDQGKFANILKDFRPFAVINAAQQPSAPFSMMSAKNAAITFTNNIVGHLNVLWSIAEADKNIKYIKLGSAGCYMAVNTECIPLEKIDLSFVHDGKTKRILNSWIPMNASDFYHQSKIADFLISDLCAPVWDLKTVTVQQSVVFGATVEENYPLENYELSTRFNYDSVFGTVLNRFVCELIIGHPLTIYGNGEQRTGFVSLSDMADVFLKLADTDLISGDHKIVHNYTIRASIKEIAEILLGVAGSSSVQCIENPRKEPFGGFEAEVELCDFLKGKDEEERKQKVRSELETFLAFTKRYKDKIDKSILLPTVKWGK